MKFREGGAKIALLRCCARRNRAGAPPLVLLAALLSGCGLSDGAGALLVDSGKFTLLRCSDMVDQMATLEKRQKELQGLMDRANEGGGGAVIGALSYRTEYETVLREQKVLRQTAADKKCDLVPTYQSDRTIR